MGACVGEGSSRGIERVGFEPLAVEGMKVGQPAMEAWMVDDSRWRCVPGAWDVAGRGAEREAWVG